MAKRGLRFVLMLAGAGALVLVIMYMGGFLATDLIQPGFEPAYAQKTQTQYEEAEAERATWADYYEAVGTVRPRTETRVEAQVSATVQKVLVRSGDRVEAGTLLVTLDNSQFEAKVGQATQGLVSAKAALELATSEYGRIKRLYERKAAPKRDMDRTQEALDRSGAAVERASKEVEEARIALSYTRIKAPESGQVVKRMIEPGDLALPGRPLLIMQTGGALRLEAHVPESYISKVRLSQELEVMVPALGEPIKGKVEEIVPSADPQTRTFLVKAVLKVEPGLYSGMFGRLLIPVGESQVVLAPAAAITRVGQLEVVHIKHKDGPRRIYVTTGRRRGQSIEILSGLSGGETLLMEAR